MKKSMACMTAIAMMLTAMPAFAQGLSEENLNRLNHL